MTIQLERYKTVSLGYSQDIKEICQPLFKDTNIDYFCYMKSTKDGRMIHLTNREDWLEYYLDSKFYEISNFRKSPEAYLGDYVLCSTMQGPAFQIAQNATNYFNIRNTITLISKQEKECEFYQFASSKSDEKIISFFINNIDLLKLFTFYFKDKAKHLLKNLHKKNIFIPSNSLLFKSDNDESLLPKEKIIQIKGEIYEKINRFYIRDKNSDAVLTKREVECIKFISLGKTAEEISIIFEISKRTVEKHIENIKIKLNLTKIQAVLEKAIKLGILQ